jgi:hypothetical protein
MSAWNLHFPSKGGADDITGLSDFTRKLVETIRGIGSDFSRAAFIIATGAGADRIPDPHAQ